MFHQYIKPTDASIKKIASKTMSMFAGRLLVSAEYCALRCTSVDVISIDGCASQLNVEVALVTAKECQGSANRSTMKK